MIEILWQSDDAVVCVKPADITSQEGGLVDLLRQQYEEGLTVQLGALGDRLTAQEMSHLTAVAQKGDVLVNEQAMDDYLSVIDEEYEKAHVADTEDLLAMGQRLRRKKGFGGTEQ